jgi:hypothetical protein
MAAGQTSETPCFVKSQSMEKVQKKKTADVFE